MALSSGCTSLLWTTHCFYSSSTSCHTALLPLAAVGITAQWNVFNMVPCARKCCCLYIWCPVWGQWGCFSHSHLLQSGNFSIVADLNSTELFKLWTGLGSVLVCWISTLGLRTCYDIAFLISQGIRHYTNGTRAVVAQWVVKVLDYWLDGYEFKSQHHQTTVGCLSKTFNPEVFFLNCKLYSVLIIFFLNFNDIEPLLVEHLMYN